MAVWVGTLLDNVTGTKQIKEQENSLLVYAAQFQIFRAADETVRCIIRQSIELDPLYVADQTKKSWMFARPLTTAEIPLGFRLD
ncbi:hypothetical protein AMR42_12520 [Limnothrix sp. PR1529]|uniref:hypothetical protein n=1 Tax=Limnothrix sp. PR1529 TaxID=1704291 RepID=UPI000C1474EC|nr:hypothetical protein [Limnothrix sp. PR1529]PIB09777.1 hypothetical protein AMR42_12520 [Limnothrix sp. PR1529]